MLFSGIRCNLFCRVLDLFLLLRWTDRLGSCSLGSWFFLSTYFVRRGNIVECLGRCVILRSVIQTLWNVWRWWRCQAGRLVIPIWGWTDFWSIGGHQSWWTSWAFYFAGLSERCNRHLFALVWIVLALVLPLGLLLTLFWNRRMTLSSRGNIVSSLTWVNKCGLGYLCLERV